MSYERDIKNSNLEVFQRGPIIYVIKKTPNESRELYLNRVNYIIRKIESNKNKSYDEIVKLSYIWRNYKYRDMIYPKSIIKSL